MGIDYGMGLSNRDPENTEMHYGIISQHAISSYALDDMEPDYGEATCPKCGNNALEYEDEKHGDYEIDDYSCSDYACEDCNYVFDSSDAYSDEPYGFYYDSEELNVHMDSDGDVWIFKSPYYTLCAYCSPCAPGAGDLKAQCDNGIKAYCLPLDWFNADDNAPCPYKIYSVKDDSLVFDLETDNNEDTA